MTHVPRSGGASTLRTGTGIRVEVIIPVPPGENMEDKTFSLSAMIAEKTGMKITNIEDAIEPLSMRKVHVVTFENGTRAIVKVECKLQPNGPMVKA